MEADGSPAVPPRDPTKQEDGDRVIFRHPALRRSALVKLAWLWLRGQLRATLGESFARSGGEGIITSSAAAVADGIGISDHRPARLAIEHLEHLGALEVLERDVVGKGRLRGQLRICLRNPSMTLRSQPPGIAQDAQAELFPSGRPQRIIPARPSIHLERTAGSVQTDPASHAHETPDQLRSHAHETPDRIVGGGDENCGQVQSPSRLKFARAESDPAFHAHETPDPRPSTVHESMEYENYVPSSVHGVSIASSLALEKAQPLRDRSEFRPRRYAPWQIEILWARRSLKENGVLLKERLYEALKEAIKELVEADQAEDATADSAKRELVEMQRIIVGDPSCHASIYLRMADGVLDGDILPSVIADVLSNMLGIEGSEKGFSTSPGAFYNVCCQRAFKAVRRPWSWKKDKAAMPAAPESSKPR